MAHLRHFLTGTILFSSISPNYEQTLKDELFGCFKYIGIPFDILDKMPTRDRKYYIMKHNNEMEKQKSGNNNGTHTTDAIEMYTDLHQSNMKNLKR